MIPTLNLTGASHVWTDEGHLVPGQRGAEVGAQVIERPTPDRTPRAIARPPSPPAASSVVEPAPARPVQLAHPGGLDRADLADRIERRLPSSYRLAALVLGDRVEAEDATHEAILSAWARAGTLRDPAAFDGWFDRILVNVCCDRLRQCRVLRLVDLEAAGSIAAPDEIRSAGTRDTVRTAFARLNPDQGSRWSSGMTSAVDLLLGGARSEGSPLARGGTLNPTRQPLDKRPGLSAPWCRPAIREDLARCSRRGGIRPWTRGGRSAC